MSAYTTPIPASVIEKLPMVLSNHSDAAFDIRIQGFPGDDGEQMFAVEVYTDPETITPQDRRQKRSTEAKRTSYYFNAEGGFDGEPETTTMRYQG